MKYFLLLAFSAIFPLTAFSARTTANVGSEFSVFHQPGTRFSNQGYASEVTGEQNLTSGIILTEKVGYEHFMGDRGNHHGLRASVLGTYGIDPTNEVSAGGTYRTLGRNWGDFELAIQFDSKKEAFQLGAGFERKFIMDSYLSYVGQGTHLQNSVGEARLHEFYADLVWDRELIKYTLRPSLGWVNAASCPSNFRGAVKGSVALLMIQENEFDLDLIYQAGFQHYQLDQSGALYSNNEPFAGGYFSPRLYIEQVPAVAARYRPEHSMQIGLTVGPSFQIVREFQKGSSFLVGAVSDLAFDYQMNERASLKTAVAYYSLVNQFGRFQTTFALTYGL